MAVRIIAATEIRNVNGYYKPGGTLGIHHVLVYDTADGGVDIFTPARGKYRHVLYRAGLEHHPDVRVINGRFYLPEHPSGFALHLEQDEHLRYDCGEVVKQEDYLRKKRREFNESFEGALWRALIKEDSLFRERKKEARICFSKMNQLPSPRWGREDPEYTGFRSMYEGSDVHEEVHNIRVQGKLVRYRYGAEFGFGRNRAAGTSLLYYTINYVIE